MVEKMQDNWPIERALCVFMGITGLIFLGYMIEPKTPDGDRIKIYMKNDTLPIEAIESYQYVLNDCNGFVFIDKKIIENG